MINWTHEIVRNVFEPIHPRGCLLNKLPLDHVFANSVCRVYKTTLALYAPSLLYSISRHAQYACCFNGNNKARHAGEQADYLVEGGSCACR